MLLDIDLIRKIVPKTPLATLETFVTAFNKIAPNYGITTPERIASFVGNCIVESGLRPIVEAKGYKPYLIKTYWDNLQKRNEFEYKTPQDAIDFSGKGYIQLTGKPNYRKASQNIFGDDRLIKNPSLVLQPEISMATSFEWWKMNGMNAVADKYGIKGVASKIQTGRPNLSHKINHLPERITAYKLVLDSVKKKTQLKSNPFGVYKPRGFFSRFFSSLQK